MSQHLKERNFNNINNINNIQEEKGAQKSVDVLSRTEALLRIADDRSKELRELKRAIREMDRELKEQKRKKGDGA